MKSVKSQTSPKTPQKVIIFGGSGFIGQHLARRLEKSGQEVFIADINAPRVNKDNFFYVDVREPINLNLDGIELIYNLAAIHRTPGHEAHEYYEANIGGAINITNWARERNIERILFTSSISVYGNSRTNVTETSSLSPVSHYGMSKQLAEKVHCNWLHEKNSRSLIICRPAVVFGSGERGNFSRLATALRNRTFVIPGSSHIVKASGYIEDLISAILFTQTNYKNAIFNFCFPRNYTIGEIARTISALGGFPNPPRIPIRLILPILRKLGLRANQMALRIEKLLESSEIIPEFLIKGGFEWDYDLQSSLAEWYQRSQFDRKLES